MSKKQSRSRLPANRARVKRLPRRDDTWQIDVRPAEIVKQAGKTGRYWIVAVVSEKDEELVALALMKKQPTARYVYDCLSRAMLHPENSIPRRPSHVQVRADRRLRGLAPLFALVGIDLVVTDELDLIDGVFEQLNEDRYEGYQRCLLDMSGVTPPIVRSLFQAAAAFYRQSPWKKARGGLIRVHSPQCATDWYAVVMARDGKTPDLILSSNLEVAERIRRGDLSGKKARSASILAVAFGGKNDILESDLEMIQEYGLQVASRNAYPLLFRQEPGKLIRPPLDWELELLDGCLRTMPKFLKRPTNPKPFEATVTLSNSQLKLTLSWAVARS